jgi:hypothetical protein
MPPQLPDHLFHEIESQSLDLTHAPLPTGRQA